MATYTSNIRLVKQDTGENDSTWGVVLNDGMISLTDVAIAGYTTISLGGGDVSLTTNNGSSDEARYAMLELTGLLTGDTGVYLPTNVTKSYIVNNNTTGSFDTTVLINGGTGHVVPQGGSIVVYTDGTTVTPAVDNTGLGLGTAATLNIGTSINELIPVSSADARYATLSTTQTITGDKTLSGNTTLSGDTLTVNSSATTLGGSTITVNSLEVKVSGTQTYSTLVSVAMVGTNLTFDFSQSNNFTSTLNANPTFVNPTNAIRGQSGIIYIISPGGRTSTWGSYWKFPNGGTEPTLSSGSVDAIVYNVRSATAITALHIPDIQ